MAPWRAGRARHDPGKVLLDVAIALALGGDCLADVAAVRAQRDLFGLVASDPTVSRLFAMWWPWGDGSTTSIRIGVADCDRSKELYPLMRSLFGIA